MTRYLFGGDGSAAVLDVTSGDLYRNGGDGVVYASLNSTTPLVDISSDVGGTTFLDHVSTDSNGIPVTFYGPDGVTQVWVQWGAGRFRLDAAGPLKRAMDLPDQIDGFNQDALTSDDVGIAGGVAGLDNTGKVPLSQLPTGLGGGGGGGGGADLDQLVINGQSPTGGTINLTPADLGAAPATGNPTTAVNGLETRLTSLESSTSANATAITKKQDTIPQFANQAAANTARTNGQLTAGQLVIVKAT